MILYLTEEEIIEINRLALESQGEEIEFLLIQPDDLDFVTNFVETQNTNDYNTLALCYCLSLIVLHPFKNGNHRTSLYSAERFLIKNGFSYQGDPNVHLNLQKWRINYEEKYEMERKFFAITMIENNDARTSEINKLKESVYGIKIREWLEKYYQII